MSIDRWMYKEAVLHRWNDILLSYKKECNWVSSSEVDEPTTYYTEWSKPERERQISYITAQIWNLYRQHWQSYLEKEIATHSSILAWRIPGMGEPGGLPSTGSHRVRHDNPPCRAAKETQTFRTQWGRWGGIICGNSTETHVSPYVK